MNKNIVVASTLNGGANDIIEHGSAVPVGQVWFMKKFGAADVNLGDNKSSVYVLRFGTEIIKIISVTGNTQEIEVAQEIIGDGTKKVNVMRYNNSGQNKQCPFWITAYERLS